MASESIIKYLTDANRPYSCADVTVNLRGAYTKTVVQKTLDALSESGKIKCKIYGKQKVYAAIQSDCADEEDDIDDFDNKFKTLTETLSEKTSALKKTELELKTLTSTPTTTDARKSVEEINERIVTMEKKLEKLRSSTDVVSAEDRKTILDEHSKLSKEYRKRKRIANDMLESVLEGYPKSKNCLIEELGIETDEMVNFKLISTT